jgi:hypothetical protein
MNSPIIGPGSMGNGAGNSPVGGINPGLSGNYKTASSAAQRAGMGAVHLGQRGRHGVKTVQPTEAERNEIAVIRKVGGGEKVVVPSVVGAGIASGKLPYVVIHNSDAGIMGLKVYREAFSEANVMVWNNQMPEAWMLYREGQAYQPSAKFKVQQAKAAAAEPLSTAAVNPYNDDDEVPLIAQSITTPPDVSVEPTPSAGSAALQAQIDALKAKLHAATERAKTAFSGSYDTTLVIEGFGELEGTCDHYEIKGSVLMLAYDNDAKRNIPNPKPEAGKQVAQFVMEIKDGNTKHVLELAAPFDSKFTFAGAGTAGVTFQQFMILQHQAVTA